MKKYFEIIIGNTSIRRMSVAIFIIVAFITVTAVMLAGFGIIDYKIEKDRQWKNLRKELSITADQMKSSLTIPVWHYDSDQVEKVIESSMNNQNIYGIIISANSREYIRARGQNWGIVIPAEEFSTEGLLLEQRDITYSDEYLGTIKLYGSTSLQEKNLKIIFISIMSFITVFVFVIIVGLYLILHKAVLKPIVNIEQYTMSVSSGESKGLKIKGSYFQGELDTLRTSIEKMVNVHEERFVDLQNEVKLRTESEGRFRTIFDSSNDGLLICDKTTGDIIHVNEKMCEMFGYTYEELIQQNINTIDIEDSKYNSDNLIKEESNFPEKSNLREWKVKNKAGEIFWTEISIKDAVIDNQKRALVAIRDITQRKQAEEDRRLSEEKYRNIFERSVEGIFQVTPDGLLISVNPSMARLFGYISSEEMVNSVKNVKNEFYVIPVEADKFKEELEHNGKIEGFETQNYRKDGEKIWVSLNARTICDSSGKIMYYEGSAMDVTMRKNAEEEKEKLESQLRQAQKMEAIGTLAGGIAHDFNNILSVVLGFGSILQREVDKNTPSGKYVDQIVLAAEKATNLISSLLSFSRKQPALLQPVKLNDVITNVEKLLVTSLTEDIAFQKKLSEQNLVIMGDVTQIEQILFNLTSNSRDAMPGGGKLTIETRLMDIKDDFTDILGYGEPGTYVLLTISDNGRGMDAQTKEHIFDPFFTTKSVGKGTGLGLSTVYGIVKQHNGFISVYSEPEMGTSFHIYFPAVSADVEDKKLDSSHVIGGNETILIAEDNDNVRYFIKTILNKWGYNVIEAQDGEDAVKKYHANDKIDLMIIDSVMPKKNGREVYDEVKKDNPDIKVLFTSGYTKDIILDKGIEEKEVEFISKPLTQNALLKKVREVIDSES